MGGYLRIVDGVTTKEIFGLSQYPFNSNVTYIALSFLTNNTLAIFSDITTGVGAREQEIKVSVNT